MASSEVELLKGEIVQWEQKLEDLTSQYAVVAQQQIEVGEQLKEYIIELEQSMDRKVERHTKATQQFEAERELLLKQLEERGQHIQREASVSLEAQQAARECAAKVEALERGKVQQQQEVAHLVSKLSAEEAAHKQTQALLEGLRKIQQDYEKSSQTASEKERSALQIHESDLKGLQLAASTEKAKNAGLAKEAEECRRDLGALREKYDREVAEKAELAKFKEEVLKRRETKRLTVNPRRSMAPNTLLVPGTTPGGRPGAAPGDRSTVLVANPRASRMPLSDAKRQTILAQRMSVMDQSALIVVKIEEMTLEMGDIEKELTEADQKATTLEMALIFTESQRTDAEKYFKQLAVAVGNIVKKMDAIGQLFASFQAGKTPVDNFKSQFNREFTSLKGILQVIQEDVGKQLQKVSEIPSSPPSQIPDAPVFVDPGRGQEGPPLTKNPVNELLKVIRAGSFSLKKVTETDKLRKRRDLRKSKAVLIDLQDTLQKALMNHRNGMLEDDIFEDEFDEDFDEW